MPRVLKVIQHKYVYIPVAIIVVVLVFLGFRKNKEAYTYETVVRADVRQEVSVTGKVQPVESVSLSFERVGRVSSVPGHVGNAVYAGQALVYLNTTADTLALAQEEARLAELLAGTRSEDIAILQSKLTAAEVALTQSRQALRDTVSDSYTTSDNAIRNYADQFFDNPRSSNPQLNVVTSDEQLKIDLNTSRTFLEKMLSEWAALISGISAADNLPALVVKARNNLESTKTLLDKLALVINALTAPQSLSATTISSYKSNIATARSAVNSALTTLTSYDTALSSAAASLDLAQKNLDLARAGTLPEQIEAQQAKVAALRHTVAVSVLRSPIQGVITRQDAKVGQVVAANQDITSVISEKRLEVEAFVPEVDIGAMAVGNNTEVTFDAFPGDTFVGHITYIDPAETVIDGVPTYKIKLSMPTDDTRIRSGMTANLSVTVAERQNVLTLPYRAVFGQNGDIRVLVSKSGGGVEEVPVVLGIRGVGGEIEIISGLEEGASVAIPSRQ